VLTKTLVPIREITQESIILNLNILHLLCIVPLLQTN
jgi:hypothetical protein